jgi:hypothetical protein
MVTATIDVSDAEVLVGGGAARGWRTVAGVVGMVARFCRAQVGDAAGDGSDGSAGARTGGGHHQLAQWLSFRSSSGAKPTTRLRHRLSAVRNPFSARINAIYGSDIGHIDVPDMSEVTAEAFEQVEHGAGKAVDDPDFFKGTVVESTVSRYLAGA